MRFRLLLPAVFLFALLPLAAQQNVPFPGAIEVAQSLEKLNQLGTVLMIAAHPDDEQTAVLAYFARGRHMRTAYLSLTRGEGGQNLIGAEQGPALGVIRTQELLAARKIDGAEQFFTRAIDFGFTKTAAETMEKWGHERILSDVVWVVRRYRPDVIMVVFSGTPSDGHGQHQVSAILAKEAFDAAADAARFPDQLQYVQPWRAKRLVRVNFNLTLLRAALPPGTQFPQPPALPSAGSVETGAFNPVLGYSYQELATMSRSMHHSQGTGAVRHPGAGDTTFGLVAGEPASKDVFEGIDTTWNRLPGGAPIGPMLYDIIRDFDFTHPEKSLPALAKVRPLIAAISDPLAKIKLAEFDQTMALCAGLYVEAEAREPEVSPGTPLTVTTTAIDRSSARVTLEGGAVEGVWNEPLAVKTGALEYNQAVTIPFEKTVPLTQAYSQPYWLVKPPNGDVYQVDNQMLMGLADTPPVATVRLKFTVEGAPIEVVRPVEYRYAPRAEGERVRLLAIVPPVAVDLPDSVDVFPATAARQVPVSVRANVAKAEGELRLDLPAGWKAAPLSQRFKLAAGQEEQLTFQVTPPVGETIATLKAVAKVNGRDVANGTRTIEYPHFPPQMLFPPSDARLVRANIAVKAHRVGYIMGAGDQMPDALRQLGVEVTLLSAADLAQGDLARFDAIVAGVRAYNVRGDLRANQSRLMNYVKNGGTYVVQYQNADPTLNMGPYPFTVPGGNQYRITVEEALVTYPHTDSPLLQAPNHIGPKDFEGWVQERALYVATKWDPQYQTVLSSHDPGEEPMDGGELWTRYGKGVYIFTAYSWFRQLPAGVPGAFRLFANMLSAK
jgi:LmbE family N-acetylglucosaminyl deacetylase